MRSIRRGKLGLAVVLVAAMAGPVAPAAHAAATNTLSTETGVGFSRLTIESRDRDQSSTYTLEALTPPAAMFPTTRMTGTIRHWVTDADGRRRFERRDLNYGWVWRDLFHYEKLDDEQPGYQVGDPRSRFVNGLDTLQYRQPTCQVIPKSDDLAALAQCAFATVATGPFPPEPPVFQAGLFLSLAGFDSDELFVSPEHTVGLMVDKPRRLPLGVAARTDLVEKVITDCREADDEQSCGKRYEQGNFFYAEDYNAAGEELVPVYSCVNETYDGPSCAGLEPFTNRLYPQRDVHLVYSFEAFNPGLLNWGFIFFIR